MKQRRKILFKNIARGETGQNSGWALPTGKGWTHFKNLMGQFRQPCFLTGLRECREEAFKDLPLNGAGKDYTIIN